MTLPSADALVRRLVNLSHLLDKAQAEIEELDEKVVQARAAHRVAHARAFIESDGPMELRKTLALQRSESERFALDLAEQKMRACRERIFTLKEQIDITQTIGATMRSEWRASGMEPG